MTLTDEHLPIWYISAKIASWSTECRPNKGAVVRPKMIDYASLIDIRNHLIAAMRVRPIVIAWAKEKSELSMSKKGELPTRTGNSTPVQLNMDFPTGMSEAK